MELRKSPSGKIFVVRRDQNYIFNVDCEDDGQYLSNNEMEQFLEETEEIE